MVTGSCRVSIMNSSNMAQRPEASTALQVGTVGGAGKRSKKRLTRNLKRRSSGGWDIMAAEYDIYIYIYVDRCIYAYIFIYVRILESMVSGIPLVLCLRARLQDPHVDMVSGALYHPDLAALRNL